MKKQQLMARRPCVWEHLVGVFELDELGTVARAPCPFGGLPLLVGARQVIRRPRSVPVRAHSLSKASQDKDIAANRSCAKWLAT
jgi:hypothetical protein